MRLRKAQDRVSRRLADLGGVTLRMQGEEFAAKGQWGEVLLLNVNMWNPWGSPLRVGIFCQEAIGDPEV